MGWCWPSRRFDFGELPFGADLRPVCRAGREDAKRASLKAFLSIICPAAGMRCAAGRQRAGGHHGAGLCRWSRRCKRCAAARRRTRQDEARRCGPGVLPALSGWGAPQPAPGCEVAFAGLGAGGGRCLSDAQGDKPLCQQPDAGVVMAAEDVYSAIASSAMSMRTSSPTYGAYASAKVRVT